MATSPSPFRYPGGKQVLAGVLARILRLNDAQGGTYVEPYAGGAGAAVSLLLGEHVDSIMINDADRNLYACWRAMLDQTDAFIERIHKVPITIKEWRRQRDIYRSPGRRSYLELGFATFFLNRCNRSGIIGNGGPIGGIKQHGPWKLGARFNRDDLERRIRQISLYKERISVSGLDAIEFLKKKVATLGSSRRPFIYLDPPYFEKGQGLYLNAYEPKHHAELARYVVSKLTMPWVMSYDNVPEIARLYRGLRRVPFRLDYTARERRRGSEVMIVKRDVRFPTDWTRGIPRAWLTTAAVRR